MPAAATSFPLPLDAYDDRGRALLETLGARIAADPFNLIATAIFVVAILHTFAASRLSGLAHRVQRAHDEAERAAGRSAHPSVLAELLHLAGEVEVVFGLWAAVLLAAAAYAKGWDAARDYVAHGVTYTEPMFVVVIMALASTRPIVGLAERLLRRIANLGGGGPAAWWATILVLGPLLGSFITEPAAMTICALLLARQFYDLDPTPALKYATLGLLFVNVSIGGTLTHFSAPPVLMVARVWAWDTPFMLVHFGAGAFAAIVASTALYFLLFRRELLALNRRLATLDLEEPDEAAPRRAQTLLPVPAWITAVHVAFMGWTVFTAHEPALFVGGFLFFLGFAKATAVFQSRLELRAPLLVGFFLGGLVIHGGLQGWWIAPVLSSLAEFPLFLGATVLTAFNDNALITYLATLAPGFHDALKIAVVQGAVTGGGLTVIANAPNPAGQALLSRFFGGSVAPHRLLAGAAVPTLIAALLFRLSA
ncbi:MAG: putative Na+/H+ antiporter [Acidobacteria bacterium]|nr:putative Na+/H+ antiporter [Acidobacteriota bacterium]